MKHEPTNGGQRRAYGLLEDWHGDMSRESRGATIFNAWLRQLRLRLVGTSIDGYWNRSRANHFLQGMIERVDPDTVGLMLSGRAGQWCRDAVTREPVACDQIVDVSLRDGLREVYRMAGDRSLQSWTWGSVHETFYRHIPFSDVNLLKTFFERRIENGGSPDSLDVADFTPGDAGAYEQAFGPGFRQVISLSSVSTKHVYMNSTGQSGNVMSTHYDDMIKGFRDVRYAPIVDTGRHRLTMQPLSPPVAKAGAMP
jgi:penicillin amidase